MHTINDLRPSTEPLTLKDIANGFDIWEARWLDPSGRQRCASDIEELGAVVEVASLPVSGVTMSNWDIEEGWAFVGVPGDRRHGAVFAKDAKDRGAHLLVTDDEGAVLAADVGLPVLVVENPRKAAGVIASQLHASDIDDLTLVGVTGTNGKTTTTYLLRAALAPICEPMGVLGTLEVDTGDRKIAAERTTHESPVVYRTLAQGAQAGMEGMVVEVSSHALSLNRVQNVLFDLAVFTNLQHDHLDFYNNSMDLYFRAKAELFSPEHAKAGVVGVDDKYGRELARNAQIPVTTVQVATDDAPDVGDAPLWKVSDARADAKAFGTRFTLRAPSGETWEAFCPIPGSVNVQNAALSIVGARVLGASVEDAIEAVSVAPSIPGRMQTVPKRSPHQPKVVVDYAHTPEAIEQLLLDFRELTAGNLIAVFGTDGDRDATKRKPLARITAELADVLWVTDENPRTEDAASIRAQLLEGVREARPDMENVFEVATSRRDAIREAILAAEPEDTILIFGKGAEPYQEIRGVKHRHLDVEVVEDVFDSTK